jgi:hypothetical protein
MATVLRIDLWSAAESSSLINNNNSESEISLYGGKLVGIYVHKSKERSALRDANRTCVP